jgi:diadenylate cyclase
MRQLLDTVTIWDLLDVLAVALIIYGLLLLIRRTRAVRILAGIVVVVAISLLAGEFSLHTLDAILGTLLVSLPFAAVVLFQDQIRRALAGFASTSLWGLAPRRDVEATVNETVLAATALANSHVGALIVLEREEGLRDFIEGGTQIDAAVTCDLLVNIFSPSAPLHDGAVIMRDDRIAAAACFLPLTRQPGVPSELGTRHRAAIGISDETDAIAIVVSEETGRMSAAHRGDLTLDLDSRELRNYLYRHLIREDATEEPVEQQS